MAMAAKHPISVPDRTRHARTSFGAARVATVLVSGAVALLVTFAATSAQVSGRSNPEVALRMWPFAAGAASRLAEARLVSETGSQGVHDARDIATQALLREPINVVAARVAGLTAGLEGNEKQSRRLLNYAEMLSRRDIPTQIAQIEVAVADSDIVRALHHYDTALRTDDVADQLLMPTLVAASSASDVAGPLASIISKRPPWRMRFLYGLLTTDPWPSTLIPLVTAGRLNINEALERDFLNRTVAGLVARGKLTEGARFYARATGTPFSAMTGAVRNGDFAREDRVAPFDWSIVDEPGLAGVKDLVDPAVLRGASLRNALSLSIEPGRSGVVARQLLLLTPGKHLLRFTVGSVDASDRSSVTLVCNGTDAPIAAIRLPIAPNRSRSVKADIDVPKGCLGQWITIEAATDINASANQGTQPWVSGVEITQSGAVSEGRS
jgi:hypothetical protein